MKVKTALRCYCGGAVVRSTMSRSEADGKSTKTLNEHLSASAPELMHGRQDWMFDGSGASQKPTVTVF